jgi:hypothetical protein
MALACTPASNPAPRPVTPTPLDSAGPAPTVETCPDGEDPSFQYGFAALKARLGAQMGTPLSCERPGPSGDALQQTTTGLARYNKITNVPSFTRGFEHWALTQRGLVHWTGRELDPPDDAEVLDGPGRPGAPPAPLSAETTAVRLRLVFVPDEVRTYTSTTRLTVESSLLPPGNGVPPMIIEARYTYRTLGVHADGSATLLASIDHVSVLDNGQSAEVPRLSRLGVRMRVAPDGSATELQTEGDGRPVTGMDAQRVAESMILFRYPLSVLRAGDSFERQMPIYFGPNLPESTLRSTYAFTGIGSIDAVPVARLEETGNIPIGDWPPQSGITLSGGQGTVHGWHYVGLNDGWPVLGNGMMTISFSAIGPDKLTNGTFVARLEMNYQK